MYVSMHAYIWTYLCTMYVRTYECICACVCAGSPPCTFLSVDMNEVMHSACAQASVRLFACACVRASVRVCMGMSVCLCNGYMSANMCVYLNVPDFSYI